MKFQAAIKYRLDGYHEEALPWYTGPDVDDGDRLSIVDGRLFIWAGYTWDGPSGLTWDSESAMVPSLVHDALYDLIRQGALGLEWRGYADLHLYDEFLRRMLARWCAPPSAFCEWPRRVALRLRAAAMGPVCRIRAAAWLFAVTHFASYACRLDGARPERDVP